MEVGIAEVGTAKVGYAEVVGIAEVGTNIWMLLPPLIPRIRTLFENVELVA